MSDINNPEPTIPTEQRDHFRIRDTPMAYPPAYQPQPRYREPEVTETINFTKVLWNFASTVAIIINILVCLILIRDMYNGAYDPIKHWFMISAFVSTILGLALIHNKVIK